MFNLKTIIGLFVAVLLCLPVSVCEAGWNKTDDTEPPTHTDPLNDDPSYEQDEVIIKPSLLSCYAKADAFNNDGDVTNAHALYLPDVEWSETWEYSGGTDSTNRSPSASLTNDTLKAKAEIVVDDNDDDYATSYARFSGYTSVKVWNGVNLVAYGENDFERIAGTDLDIGETQGGEFFVVFDYINDGSSDDIVWVNEYGLEEEATFESNTETLSFHSHTTTANVTSAHDKIKVLSKVFYIQARAYGRGISFAEAKVSLTGSVNSTLD